MQNRFAAACAIALGFAGVASANESGRLQDGAYVIQVNKGGEAFANEKVAGCLIISNNGRNAHPSVYAWSADLQGTYCGLSTHAQDLLQNKQAVWHLYTVRAGDGKQAYVLKSAVNGRCLIRGSNGHASRPSLHLWTEYGAQGNSTWCGFRSAEELIANGQAAWSFDGFPLRYASLAYSASTGVSPDATISFGQSATPNTDPHVGFATFTVGENPWRFVFWPL